MRHCERWGLLRCDEVVNSPRGQFGWFNSPRGQSRRSNWPRGQFRRFNSPRG
jgi:hypothetical protein